MAQAKKRATTYQDFVSGVGGRVKWTGDWRKELKKK